ncbi:MAG: peptidoglycan editing factor PgeF [Luteimonas sp.]
MPGVPALVTASVLRADWPAPPGVHALNTMRGPAGTSVAPFDKFDLGLRNGDDATIVADNRALLQRGLELPAAPHWLRQVHGTTVHRVVNRDPSAGTGDGIGAELEPEPEADAAVTGASGVVLAVLTADCLPVVLAARDGSEVAVAHAGWRGLAAGVLEATVAAMQGAPGTIIAWLGPAAGPAAYEVGSEVRDAFMAHDPRAAAAFVPTRHGHWNLDLYALARQRLAGAGVAAVHGGGLCTISDPSRFYSHRRDQRSGRMATLVWRQR